MEYILLTSIGILLGIAISQFLQISKLWKRVNVMFDSIFTNHNRLNDMEKQIDKIYGHLSWCEGRISESLPTPEDFSPINPPQTENTPWE